MHSLVNPLVKARWLMHYPDSWIVSISDRFQYGQKNKNGDGRWVALHDKDNKPYQVSSSSVHHNPETLLTLIAPLHDYNYPGSSCRVG